jgi:hypothetical protein
MTTREVLVRLAAAGLLLVTIGAVAKFTTHQPMFPERRHHVELLQPTRRRYSTIELLRHRWVDICVPFPSEVCA